MELKELFAVQAELNHLKSLCLEKSRLKDFNPYGQKPMTGMPGGGGGKNLLEWIAEETDRLDREIEDCLRRVQKEREKVERYIEAAPVPEKDIIRYRVINGMGWGEIGDVLRMDRRTASRRFYEYINAH